MEVAASLYNLFRWGHTHFLTRGSVATKFRKNEAESCLLSCELRLRCLYFWNFPRAKYVQKNWDFFPDFSDGEQNLCFWFLIFVLKNAPQILPQIKNLKNQKTSSVLHSELDLSCFALLAQTVACIFWFEAQKLFASCLGFPKIEAQSLEKKLPTKKSVTLHFGMGSVK